MNDTSALFEFLEPNGGGRWVAKPGEQTTFPLSIRNDTAEGHEVAVLVEDPANWAWADPQRISLDPGDSTTVTIVFAPQKETSVAAGRHQAAIRLRDLEGVIFAECLRSFDVEERQELAMTVTLRGPLMSFGMAEGFVVHCTLVNRGNTDVTARPVGDPHPALSFTERTVSVPFRGEVAFDIEVRWNAARRSNHPDVVTLRAPYKGGEAKASIEWRYIADALEPFMPIYSTAEEEEDEFLSISWLPKPGEDVLDRRLPQIPAEEAPERALHPAQPVPASQTDGGEHRPAEHETTTPSAPPVNPALLARRTFGARVVSPWWPPAEVIAGRWRFKPLPILMVIIAVEGFLLGMTQAQRNYYASPELREPVRVQRVLTIGSHAAQAIVGGAEHAISVTLNAGKSLERRINFGHRGAGGATAPVPALWGLSAHYTDAHTLSVSFNETGCTQLQLIVASGPAVLYHRQVSSQQVTVPIRSGLSDPLRITVVGEAPGGIELRQHSYLALPFANDSAPQQQ